MLPEFLTEPIRDTLWPLHTKGGHESMVIYTYSPGTLSLCLLSSRILFNDVCFEAGFPHDRSCGECTACKVDGHFLLYVFKEFLNLPHEALGIVCKHEERSLPRRGRNSIPLHILTESIIRNTTIRRSGKTKPSQHACIKILGDLARAHPAYPRHLSSSEEPWNVPLTLENHEIWAFLRRHDNETLHHPPLHINLPLRMEFPRLIQTLIAMRPEEVPLGLDEILREPGGAVGIEVGE